MYLKLLWLMYSYMYYNKIDFQQFISFMTFFKNKSIYCYQAGQIYCCKVYRRREDFIRLYVYFFS